MQDDARNSLLITKVRASVDHICTELKLDENDKSKCIKLASYLDLGKDGGNSSISKSLVNAIGCAHVSIAHTEAWRTHVVPRRLPDRIIGILYG
jgi:hypothetical protein